MGRRRVIFSRGIFVFLIAFCSIFSLSIIFGATNQTTWTIIDDNLEVYIVVEGVNIKEADNRIDSILIDSDGLITASAEIASTAETPIELEELNIAFIWANLDAYTNIQKLDSTLHPGNTLSVNQTYMVGDYLGFKEAPLVSGIYKFRYSIEYTVNNSTRQMEGDPFYLKIECNPLVTVTGAAATIAVASSGLSLFWVGNSIRKISPMEELKDSIDSSYIAPTKKLLSFYKGRTYKSIQNEISNALYKQASSWKGDKCPACCTEWPENINSCIKCQISFEEAQQLYAQALEDRYLKTSKEIVDSVSGLSLYSITNSLGEGVVPTTSIISVLTSSGLTLVQPRVSHRMSEKTRRLVFTSLSTALLSILWIQAVGIEVVSLTMLLIAILTGTIPAMLIRRALELDLKKKIINYFNQITES